MWELISCLDNNPDEILLLQRLGFEPFTVTVDLRANRIWFRKETNEVKICSESTQSVPRRGRKVAPKS